jgi:Ca2+-transporting ATPase
MTTIYKNGDSLLAYTKGAGEIIIKNCSKILTSKGIMEINDEDMQRLEDIIETFGKESLRVIGLAYNDSKNLSKENSEDNMVFTGFAAMIDPPRPEAITAIKECKEAGIKPVMITGDHKITAVTIAREMGILTDGKAFSGEEIEQMCDKEFNEVIEHAEVFARISPAHKMKIVESLMSKGNIVAMTGDGVNDAPSLKKSNIGIAMGITGTDVSKEASDMILTDDNFASIVIAVKEGRTIFENIRKYLVYLLSGNMGTVFALIGSMIAGFELPLTAVQILFINFVMDGLIAIALGVEKPEQGVMNKKPRKVQEGILNKEAMIDIVLIGLVIAAVSFGVYGWSIMNGAQPIVAGTMFFITLIIARLFNGLACRSLNRSAFAINPISNPALLVSILATLILVFFIIDNSFLQKTFKVTVISMEQWFVIISTGFMVILFTEIFKGFKALIKKIL